MKYPIKLITKYSINLVTSTPGDVGNYDSPRSLIKKGVPKNRLETIFDQVFDPDDVDDSIDASVEAISKMREATFGLTSTAASALMTRPLDIPRSDSLYKVPTILADRMSAISNLCYKINTSGGSRIQFKSELFYHYEVLEILIAYSFMIDAARDRSLPFACPRVNLIRLAQGGKIIRTSIAAGDPRLPLYHWPIKNQQMVEVSDGREKDDWNFIDSSGDVRTFRMGYFDLTPRDLYHNFKWLSEGDESHAKAFTKKFGAFFDHTTFSFQYIHSMIRDIRVSQSRPPVWLPKIIPRSFDSIKSFTSIPIRNLPEAKLWFSSPDLLLSGVSLSAPTVRGRSHLADLMDALRSITYSGVDTLSVLKGLPPLSDGDTQKFLQEQEFDALLKEALVTSYSSNKSKDVDKLTDYDKAAKEGIPLLIFRVLQLYADRRSKYRYLSSGSSSTANSNGIFINFTTTKR